MIGIYEILCTIIFNYLDFYVKHTFKRIRKFMNQIFVTDSYNIEWKYLDKLNYKFAVELNAHDNPKISDVNHMKN